MARRRGRRRSTVNQTIVEIETAKSLVELPSPFTGVVSELLVEVGATVDVGTPIIVIDVDPTGAAGGDEDGDGAEEAADDTSGDVLVGYGTKHAHGHRRPRKGAPAADAAAPAPVAPAPVAAAPTTTAPPAPARVVAPAAPAPAAARPAAASTSGPMAGVRATSGPAAGVRATSGPAAGLAPANSGTGAELPRSPLAAAVLAKPPVRKLAKDLGVDLSVVTASGPGGIVTREDVLAHSAEVAGAGAGDLPG